MGTASIDEGRAKPKLLDGAYQKLVAASVGELQYQQTVRKGLMGRTEHGTVHLSPQEMIVKRIETYNTNSK